MRLKVLCVDRKKTARILELLKKFPKERRESELRAAIRRSEFKLITSAPQQRALIKAVAAVLLVGLLYRGPFQLDQLRSVGIHHQNLQGKFVPLPYKKYGTKT